MHRHYAKFMSRTNVIESRFEIAQSKLSSAPIWESRSLCETLVSDLWQLWCNFCREVIHLSCNGCILRDGIIVVKRPKDNSWQRIGYEAAQASRNQSPKPGKLITQLRQEPTWGDQAKLIDILNVIQPHNDSALITAFGLPVQGPKHLQIVRNACAHKNAETLADVQNLTINYSLSSISTPTDLLWSINRLSRQCAIYQWIDDCQLIAFEATK